MNGTVLQARDVHREYRMGEELVHAVRGVSLDIDEGEYLAIVGPSGCGKSTLLNLLGGIDRPSSGTVTIRGRRLDEMRDAELTRFRLQQLGFVFQRFYLMPALTASENVELPLAEARVSTHQRRKRARSLLEYVGLAGRLDHRPAQLSGGEQQRVAIARALVTNPAMILADEPTGNLDSHTSEEIMGIFQELNDAGKTIVLITHEPDIARHAKRVVTVRDGLIQQDEKVDQIRVEVKGIAPPVKPV